MILLKYLETLEVSGNSWSVRVEGLGGVPESELKERVGSLVEERDQLKRALDILIDGF